MADYDPKRLLAAKPKLSLKRPESRGVMLGLLKRILQENGRLFIREYAVAVVCLVLVAGTTAFMAWIMRDVIDEIFVQGNRAAIVSLPIASRSPLITLS